MAAEHSRQKFIDPVCILGLSLVWMISCSSQLGNEGRPIDPRASVNSPRGLSLEVLSSTEIRLTWLDVSDDETGFEIERRISGETSYVFVHLTDENVTQYTDGDLEPATSYEYRLRAINDEGSSLFATAGPITTQASSDQDFEIVTLDVFPFHSAYIYGPCEEDEATYPSAVVDSHLLIVGEGPGEGNCYSKGFIQFDLSGQDFDNLLYGTLKLTDTYGIFDYGDYSPVELLSIPDYEELDYENDYHLDEIHGELLDSDNMEGTYIAEFLIGPEKLSASTTQSFLVRSRNENFHYHFASHRYSIEARRPVLRLTIRQSTVN